MRVSHRLWPDRHFQICCRVLKAVDLVVVLMFSAIIVVFVNLRYHVCQMRVNHRLWPDRHFQICCRVLKSVDLVVVLLFSAIIAKGAE
jgi:hypothetical protein